jgi:hypothetical protein
MMLTLLESAIAVLALALASPLGQSSVEARASGFWYAQMDHSGASRGYAPYAENAASYSVFKAVKSGDSSSIQEAIDSAGNGHRQKEWFASQPRVRGRWDPFHTFENDVGNN